MASLEELLKKSPPSTSKANTKGGDKTPLEADGGRKLGKGASGHTPTKPYSDKFK